VVTVLEGESLVNDASGLVLYKFAVAAVMTGAFSLFDASIQFVGVSIGGVAIGMAFAWLFVAVHRRLGDTLIEVLVSLTVPYIAYIFAESVHASGVLAVVAAGLVRGRYSPEIVSAETRIVARSVWNLLVFLLNSLVFMLIGIQLSGMLHRLSGYSATELFLYGAFVSAVAIIVRFAWIYPAVYLPRLLHLPWLQRREAPREEELFIMSWCGMRGIVSLAAALGLPVVSVRGEAFPERDLIIFLTFVVIAVTLVLQGLTLPALIRRLKVGKDRSLQAEHTNARRSLRKAAIVAIDEMVARTGVPDELADRIRAEFSEKTGGADGPVPGGDADLARQLRRAAIHAERQELIRIWRENQISDDVLHHVEEDLDYQESHI
jgi:CPA1 family monovalent cation:H+ antiporter